MIVMSGFLPLVRLMVMSLASVSASSPLYFACLLVTSNFASTFVVSWRSVVRFFTPAKYQIARATATALQLQGKRTKNVKMGKPCLVGYHTGS